MTPDGLNIDAAVAAIKLGQIIAYPTEGVYGLGCDPFNEAAVRQLCALKQRPLSKGLILVASQWLHVHALIDTKRTPSHVITQLEQHWPDATTYLLPANTKVPHWVRGDHTQVAIRLSQHDSIQQLCNRLNHPLVSTSANLSGSPTLQTAAAISQQFESAIAGVLSGRLGGNVNPSSIVDAVSGQLIRP